MNCLGCRVENREGARFCRECGAAFGATCSSCGARVEPRSKFCDGCGAPLAAAPAPRATPTRFDSPESYTPQHLIEKILTSKSALEGERKQVTVLFADLKGSMELLADQDPEEAPGKPRARILAASPRVRGQCTAPARRHRDPSRPVRRRERRGPLPPGAGARGAARNAPTRRPLPPRPRQALPARGQARAGPRAPDRRDDDVPRDGHAILAGAGGGRAEIVELMRGSRCAALG